MSHSHGHDHNGCCNHDETPEVIQVELPPETIHRAAARGDLVSVKRHLSENVDVNQEDEDKNTALHHACYQGKLDVVKHLLSVGANVNASGNQFAQTPSMWAVVNGHLNVLHYLLEQGISLHQTDSYGYNFLHHAIQNNRTIIAHYLLEKGIQIDIRDNEGHTPLMWAAYCNFDESVRYLISQGADVHLTDNTGMTALHWAAIKGHKKCIFSLMEFGADCVVRDRNGESSFELAQKKGFKAIANKMKSYQDRKRLLPPMNPLQRNLFWFAVMSSAVSLFFFFMCSSPNFIIGALLSAGMIYGLIVGLGPIFPGNEVKSPIWAAVVITTYVMSAYCYFTDIIEHTSEYTIETSIFLLLNIIWPPLYYKCLVSDPGFLKTGNEWKMYLNSMEQGEELPSFCLTCNIRRPIRAKHCRACNRCVARFDHHCGWINNCVGINNFVVFMACLAGVVIDHIMFFRFACIYLSSLSEAPSIIPINVSIPFYYVREPWIFCLTLFHLNNICWLSFLLFGLMRGIRDNITTNESINSNRYTYLKDAFGRYSNPFNRGFVNNALELLHPSVDWYHLYFLKNRKETV